MIFRGLMRSNSGANNFAGVVSDYSSQECSGDVYDFTLPSQESRQLTFSDSRKRKDCDEGFAKSKKAKVRIDSDSSSSQELKKFDGSSSSEEFKKFGVLENLDGDSKKSKNLNKVCSDPYEYNSSEDFAVSPRRNGGDNRVVEFSEHGDLLKSKKFKNLDSYSYGLNSSKVLGDLRVSVESKKKDRGQIGNLEKSRDFQKSEKLKKVDLDPYEYDSSQELKEFSVFEFSEHEDLSNSKKFKNVDSYSYGLNSSKVLGDLKVSVKSKKKDGLQKNGDFQKSEKLKKVDLDPYEYDSSQNSEGFASLPQRNGKGNRVFEFSKHGDLSKSKKFKNVELQGLNSLSKLGDLRVSAKSKKKDGVQNGTLEKKKDFQKIEKPKKVNSDPYEYDSSQDLEEFASLPQRNGRGNRVFEFSEHRDLSKSKKLKNVDSYSHRLNSSPKLGDLRVSEKSKKTERGQNGSLQKNGDIRKSEKLKKVDSDPYEYDSSQELEDFSVLPQINGRGNSVFEFSEHEDLSKSTKLKNIDSYSYGLNSSKELNDLRVLSKPKKDRGQDVVLQKNEDLPKSNKLKKNTSDFFEYNSSQDFLDLTVLSQTNGMESSVFEFSDEGDLCKSKKFKNVDSHSYGLNSSQELGGFAIPQSRKSEGKRDCWGFDGVHTKSKKESNKNKEKVRSGVEGITTTLMETQEFGEMREHDDEVSFALDGLKKGQPVRIQRASLLSLLSICETADQRRLLRLNRMMKSIFDAVSGLSLDDQPSYLAAAALIYIVSSDGQDDHLLGSPSCVRFLTKLLKPLKSSPAKEKSLPIGSRLLGLCKNAGFSQDSAKGTDSSSTAIMLKVHEILVNCKEIKPREDSDGAIEEPELNPKWISLLIMEKACSSSISIEETFGTVRKSGGNFKEKLRVFGGLDAVFEVARKCHSVMEEWLEKSPTFAVDSKDTSGLESLALLLKCLKIMENATFLSNANQCHLLEIKRSFDGQQAPRSFTKLVLSIIKILSGVSLKQSNISEIGFGISEKDSLDPFAFDEDDIESSKWDFRPGRVKSSFSQDSTVTVSGFNFCSQQESNNMKYCRSQEASCSSAVDEDKSELIADCLLTAVKVLMNLTNDNPEGCQQIATCGGLEITSSLIAGHFPSFSLSLRSKSSPRVNKSLTDQELDFLVAILGLLVNLIEKDGHNRSRLAAATVSLPGMNDFDLEDQSDVISLLCSIFLANQGAGEAAGDGNSLSLEDEDSVLLQGEKEAEKMIVEAYSALLLAFLSTESKSVRKTIAECLPKQNLAILVPVLERFVEFHMTLNMISPETHSAVLEVMESCRVP